MSRPAQRLPAATPVYRVALVSGANRGLGFEVARQLSERGMTVLLGARDLDKGLQAARKLGGAAGDVIAVALDVTAADQVDTLTRWIDATYGRLDVLVNNAGGHYDPDAHASNGDIAEAREALETHLFGSWRLSSAMLPLMRRRDYGRSSTSPAAVPRRSGAQILRGLPYIEGRAQRLYARPGRGAGRQRHHGQGGMSGLGRYRTGWTGRPAGAQDGRAVSSGPPAFPRPRRPANFSATAP